MSKQLVLYIAISYFALFGGVYLLVKCMDLIEDYLDHRRVIQTLKRIEGKVDQLPNGMNRVRTKEEIEDEWWFANR